MSEHPVCVYCEEPVLPADRTHDMFRAQPMHFECGVRAVVGSVAHIERRCGCFVPGSDDNDAPGLTKRQGAAAAIAAYNRQTLGNTGNFPRGKLNADDEGELRLAITNNRGKVLVDFGAPVKWLGLDPQGAAEMAEAIMKHAIEAANEAGVVITAPRWASK